ncbi:hypothetical protein HYV49_03510 [Candidatus Pacearchaeota archaeon]|nr:hypothetical protein [Candidatus Pacearchaeota archaeon]
MDKRGYLNKAAKSLIVVIILFSLIWIGYLIYSAFLVSAAQVSSCQILSTDNTIYYLTQNVSSNGTCFTITANNITLDGNGSKITYGINGTSNQYGVYLPNELEQITIKNLIIEQKNSSGTDNYAIYFNTISNSRINNNTIITNGSGSNGVELVTSSGSNIISNNTITIQSAKGISTASGSVSNTIVDNKIISGDGGIVISTSFNNIKNNTINITGSNNNGILLTSSSAYNNNINNNTIIINGSSNSGIQLSSASNNTFVINIITITGTNNLGILIASLSDKNIFIDSIINASGSSSNDTQFSSSSSGTINFTNVTLANNKVGFASGSTARLNVHWYFDSNVTQNNNSILPNVNISGYNVSGAFAFSNLTGSNGIMGRQIVLAYWQNRTVFSDQNNYTINFTKTGYNTTSISRNFTTNLFLEAQVNDSIAPTIAINDPQPQTYSRNTSIPFNNTASDLGVGLSQCKWNLDNGANSTVTCNSNITFNASEGTHTLNLYSNDSFNNLAYKNVTFRTDLTSPAVVLNAPLDNSYLNYQNNIYFNYTPTDSNGIDTCKLYGNWTGSFAVNYTWISPNNATQNSTSLNITNDNQYIWNVECNDTLNNNASAINNFTFTIDTTLPVISIDTITTTTDSKTVSFNSSYTEVNCNNTFYSVLTSSGAIENLIENVSLSCSNMNDTFTVSSFATYNLKVYVRDKAGNENSKTKSFATEQSGGGGDTGSSGGGGSLGRRANKTEDFSLLLSKISDIIIRKIEKKSLSIQFTNNGAKFLNNCRLKGNAEFESWIESIDEKDLAPGQKEEFIFTLKIPEEVAEGEHKVIVNGICEEINSSSEFNVFVTTDKFEFRIKDIIDEGDNIKVVYSIIELSNNTQTLNIEYWIEKNSERFLEGSKTLQIGALATLDDSIVLSKGELVSGIYAFKIRGVSEYGQSIIEESIVVSKNPLTGLVTLIGTPQGLISIVAVLLIVIVIVFITIRKVWSKKMGLKTEKGGIVHVRKIPQLRPVKYQPIRQASLSNKQSGSNAYKRLKDYELKQLKE